MAGMASETTRPKKTVEDYLALPDDVRAELIEGELYMTPTPSLRHQDVVGQVYVLLDTHARRKDRDRAFIAPLDVHLPSGDVVEPDVIYVKTANRSILDRWIHGVPDLLVEVILPSHPERDLFVKRHLYARNEVPEYWIVDPEAQAIQVLRLEGAGYEPTGWFRRDSTLISPSLQGLKLPLAEVFRDI